MGSITRAYHTSGLKRRLKGRACQNNALTALKQSGELGIIIDRQQ